MNTEDKWLRNGGALTLLVASLLCGSLSAQTPSVRIAATSPETSEPRPDARIAPGVFTISRDTGGNQPLVVYLKYGGSAMNGSDYDVLPEHVTIPAGSLSTTLQVIALSDPSANEGEENVAALLQSPPAGTVQSYQLAPDNWASVVIHDGPAVDYPPIVTIADGIRTVERCPPNADCAGIMFRIRRTAPGLDKPLTVFLRYEGSATSGVDYEALPSSVTFAAGQTDALVNSIPIDDTLVEGDENIVAVITDPPPVTPPAQAAYRHFQSSDRGIVVIDDDESPGASVVTIKTDGEPARTIEPCPACGSEPVKITVTRSGPLSQALSVGLRASGTATSGTDYHPVPEQLIIPAGAASASFSVQAMDDSLAEGPEIVEIALDRSSGAFTAAGPGYVYVVIADDEANAPAERIDFVNPKNGTGFPSGVPSIPIRALAVSTHGEIDRPTEFFANGVSIGRSDPPQYLRPSIPFLVREHDMVWASPADGQYLLTAKVQISLNQWLEAPPIQITVGPGQQRPTVSIVATSRVAEEDSAPTMRAVVFRGEFTVSRTGSTANPQTVYLIVSGSAVPGKDYKALPFAVNIPAGSASTRVVVEAIPDNLQEPLETVIAEVSNCPPGPILPPCFDFEIDPLHARDTVFVRDDGITRATLETTRPANGDHFSTGRDIVIDCTAIDIDGAITAVDFYSGNQKIGESQIIFIVPPPPGSPVMHSFTWTGAPAGTHTLTTQATFPGGTTTIRSQPVTITVGDNQPPGVRITAPPDGAQFLAGGAVEITAAATDPDGYTNYAEFFANGHKLGDMRLDFLVPPPPGETQTYSFTWSDAPPGNHMLSVRVQDDDRAKGLSAPVNITVSSADGLPVVVVLPSDPFAVEPSGTNAANTASFRLRRYGNSASDLAVNYSMRGTATNGTDYKLLNGTAVIPAGQTSVLIPVEPLADALNELRESVILQVEPQFDDGPERYRVGQRRRAAAVIVDASWQPEHPGDINCALLAGGNFHLCLAAAPAPAYRIEASRDLRNWQTVLETAAVDNMLHFIDPDTPELPQRFYRLAEDPNATGP